MEKKTNQFIVGCGAAVWVCWFVLGVLNLYRGNISKITYGCCWFVALWYIAAYYWGVWDRWKMTERKNRVINGLLHELAEQINRDDRQE